MPAVFRLAVDGLRGLGTCILVGSARAGTEVSFEMPWLQGGRTVRGVIQGDSRPRDFIPRLVDLFMAGRMPLDRLVTRYDFADINRAAADAISGAAIKPGAGLAAVRAAPVSKVWLRSRSCEGSGPIPPPAGSSAKPSRRTGGRRRAGFRRSSPDIRQAAAAGEPAPRQGAAPASARPRATARRISRYRP